MTPDTTIVFYGYAPLLGYWLMDRHGHERMRVMDSPREQWEGDGREWSAEVPEPDPTSYVSEGGHVGLLASMAEVQEAIGDPDTVILYVRSPEEFSGERSGRLAPPRMWAARDTFPGRSTCRCPC